MKNLIVVDLDNTLIPFDSFKKYIFLWCKYYPIKVPFIALLRKLRLINKYEFKKRILSLVSQHTKYNDINKKIAAEVLNHINTGLLEKIKSRNEVDKIFLLLSASPNDYVKIVAQQLCWEGKGSYFNSSGTLIHMYGRQKLTYVENTFSSEEINFCYAIADAVSDLELLNIFNDYEIV